ncbi:MAG: hypothetical protein IJ658_07615 [Kiritimatiellae bacterium]|nr:hypothetical protein [Kiritimatiellia bacterium]
MSGKSCATFLSAALAVASAAHGDAYTVAAGDVQTLANVTNTTRVTKDGAGKLVLTGNNDLATLTASEGAINIHGGETTISGAGSSGAYGDAAFVNNGDAFIVDGGATVKITGGAYANSNNGILLVTNGTFDATGLGNDLMNGFTGSFPSSRIVINDGGVVKAGRLRVVGAEGMWANKKESFSIDLNAGGALYVNHFWEDNGSRYGRINFNGGVLHPTRTNVSTDTKTHIFYEGSSNKTWTDSLVTPTVLTGGCYIEMTSINYFLPAFKSGVAEGETDGGRYAEASNYAHVEVAGGKINLPNIHWLMGLTGPAKLSVSNGGEFAVGVLRLGQAENFPTEFNLGAGGVIRPKQLLLEFNNNQDVTFNFDGGHFQSGVSNDGYSSLFHTSSHTKWEGVKFYVRAGGAVLDTSNDKHCWWSRPLLSGAEQDGGLTCLSATKAIVLCDGASNCTYNGPTRVICTNNSGGWLQCRVANALPPATTLQISPKTHVGFNSGWDDNRDHDLPQTVARVEGAGLVEKCTKLVVTDGVSPVFDGTYGTLTFEHICSLAGEYAIVGDTNGCGCVKFNQNQDVSNLSLKFADVAKMDAHARSDHYKIVDAPNGITGTFGFADDWPMNWSVKVCLRRQERVRVPPERNADHREVA